MSTPGGLNNLLLASAAGGAAGYAIERSVRFNSGDSAYLDRTPASAGNRRTWTWAGWVKRGALNTLQTIFGAGTGSSVTTHHMGFLDSTQTYPDSFYYAAADGAGIYLVTTQVFRDPSAWYHIVLASDTTQATSANRVKLYVNGLQITQFAVSTYPSQDYVLSINNNVEHQVGARYRTSIDQYFNGYLADVHFIDGQALDPTSFGEFDDNGIWQPIEATITGINDGSTYISSATLNSGLRNAGAGDSAMFDGVIPSSYSVGGNFGGVEVTPSTTSSSLTINLSKSLSGRVTIYPYFAASAANCSITFSNGNTVSLSGSRLDFSSYDLGTQSSFNSFTLNQTFISGGGSAFAIGGIAIDGQLLIDGDTTNYGPNGFHLDFSDNSTAAALGYDAAGSNDWTVNNISVAAGAGNDSLVDVPTNGTETDTGVGGEVRGNYATWNPIGVNLQSGSTTSTLSNGNLDIEFLSGTNALNQHYSTIAVSSGKWYLEWTDRSSSPSSNSQAFILGVMDLDYPANFLEGTGGYGITTGAVRQLWLNGSNTNYWWSGTPAQNDVYGIALDCDNNTVSFYRNGSSLGAAQSIPAGKTYAFAIQPYQWQATPVGSANFGQRPFAYTAPSGFKALCTANLDAPVVTKPSEYMDVALYTGNGTSQTISGLDFSPDLVWIKARSDGQDNNVFDAVRGVAGNYYALQTNATTAEGQYGTVSALTSDGFTLSNGGGATNFLNTTYVAWTWDAGSSTASNTDGSITSSVRANPSAGFSIVTWTGTGSGSATVGHGLGAAPAMIITRGRNTNDSWWVYHKDLTSNAYYLWLNSTAAQSSATYNAWNSTSPTSTVFTAGPGTNTAFNQVSYCFAPVEGYSAFGSYTGNGSADGPFVYTGMRPRWLLVKRTSSTGNWNLFDTSRSDSNLVNKYLLPNDPGAEFTFSFGDILSNGFKLRDTSADWNASGASYVYAAFAEAPINYARAR